MLFSYSCKNFYKGKENKNFNVTKKGNGFSFDYEVVAAQTSIISLAPPDGQKFEQS